MRSTNSKLLIFLSAVFFLTFLSFVPAVAVTVIWKAPNVDVTIGLPFNSLEFENPLNGTEKVKNYNVVEWLDADYTNPGYKDWFVNDAVGIDGNVNEIWMRNLGHIIWTNDSTKSSDVVSVHLVGDKNDGQAEVLVDNVLRAVLDMGTAGLPQTALVVVRDLPYTTHNFKVKDIGWGIRSRLGDDVATLGAAILNPNWRIKWWPHYWFLNGRISLVYSRGSITIPTGFWWGWWPWYYGGYWFRPWQGPFGWYEPYCRYWYRPYWDYWPWYRYYRPWWHYWRWSGGPWFWGFYDRLTYRYWYWQPRIIYWWSWYWDPPGKGGCMEMVCQADETNSGGPRVKPFEQPSIPGFEYGGHQYSVNGGKAEGDFSSLYFIQTSQLASYYRGITGVTESDVNTLMDSDLVKELQKNDPSGEGYVGFQYATWDHPEPKMLINTGSFDLYEGDTSGNQYRTYDVNLPSYDVNLPSQTVNIVSSDPEKLHIMGSDPDGVLRLNFYGYNWADPQPVTVMALDNSHSEGETKAVVAHYLSSDPNEGLSLDVTIHDNECGGWDYAAADLNNDCVVDFKDFAEMANDWLVSTEPSFHI